MKKIIIFISLIFLSNCASFGRGLGEAFIDSDKTKLDRCEIEGFEYKGMNYDFKKDKYLKVLMVHGVGTHHPGYSRRIQQNLANNLGLTVKSRTSKNIKMMSPTYPNETVGHLQITFWQNEDKSKNMLFYEQTWSEVTTPYKKIIAFDETEQYTMFRVPFNNMMKKFLDNVLPDPMLYIIDKHDLILDSSRQALCWMIKTDWDTIPNNSTATCHMNVIDGINKANKEKYLFVTHSLGSKILMDALVDNAEGIISLREKTASPAELAAIKKLRDKEITVFMLANQLPILQIGEPKPKVYNQVNNYCYKNGSKYNSRVFKSMNIVAFSDPNDILSYPIPQTFADEYLDSRLCPMVTNVSVNVAPEIKALGFGVVDPIAAHIDYDNSPKVIDLISNGTYDFQSVDLLKDSCHFIKLEKDSFLKP